VFVNLGSSSSPLHEVIREVRIYPHSFIILKIKASSSQLYVPVILHLEKLTHLPTEQDPIIPQSRSEHFEIEKSHLYLTGIELRLLDHQTAA
jgi:hypothetical protein